MLTTTSDLEQTLKRYQSLAPNDQVDFDFDLLRCTWHDVLRELERAQAAVLESDGRGKRFHRRVWRGLGSTGPVIAPGLAAIPDNLCVLHGGLAVVFSVCLMFEVVKCVTNSDSSSSLVTVPKIDRKFFKLLKTFLA